ncbi:hypothetical protein CMV_008462 [Castanea mollissima]|uniref:Uncharacterized protein n=1 Tax=Castanea mollissima TaxID=60419 RepID=A0A8J4RLR9_9ROSI|nr:hypothetical protein CMV_008462 [Castanea mollissima]
MTWTRSFRCIRMLGECSLRQMSLKPLPNLFVRVSPIASALPSQTAKIATQNIVTPSTAPATALLLLNYMCKRISWTSFLK